MRSRSATSQLSIVRREARAVASAIDLVVIALIGVGFASAALIAMLIQVDPFARDPTLGEWIVGYAVFLLALPASVVYASLGPRTLGARLLRLQMSPDPRWRLLVRGLMWWPSLLIVGAGLWWAWIDAQGRSLTDVVSGTLLVETIDP